MRIVVLTSSPWSETTTAICLALANAGHIPVGVISLPALHWKTGIRKIMQLGPQAAARFLFHKLPGQARGVRGLNTYLIKWLEHNGKTVKTVKKAAKIFGFPVLVTRDLNSLRAVQQVQRWKAELLIYTGGGIVRQPLIQAAMGGMLNSHIALLPQIRGMSAPEWSLLEGVCPGVTIHFIDKGVDTGPIIMRRELGELPPSIAELREKLVALGIEMLVETVLALDKGGIVATPQSNSDEFRQYFVMHEKLVEIAEARLAGMQQPRGQVAVG